MNLASLENPGLFAKWRDPESGVTSYVLHRRVAPLQQSFYFTNDSFSRDARYCWFYCAFPPGGDAYYGRQLGVVDFATGGIHYFPETQFMDASPFIEPETGEAYWTTGLEIWKRSPQPSAPAERIGIFPDELAKGRRPLRLATHLSLSADKTSFAIDAQIGDEWYVGDLPLNGSGFRLWQQFDRCYNHAQFSPTDPDLLLIAQDGWTDAATGEKGGTEDRLWLLRRGEKAKPIFAGNPSALKGHEWWDAGGQHVWYVHYHQGTEKVNILTGETTLVPGRPIHSHADRKGLYVASDRILSSEVWEVTFTNIATGKTIPIAAHLPALPDPRSRYHVHPHPHFCLDDEYICYTTNVLGQVDVAFTPVANLIARTE